MFGPDNAFGAGHEAPLPAVPEALPKRNPDAKTPTPFDKNGPSFGDFLDIVNPLQHIPIISSIYRHFTGDSINVAPRVFGGLLYGGPIGLMVSVANFLIESTSGKDIGGHVVAALFDKPATGSLLADAGPPAATADAVSPLAEEKLGTVVDFTVAAGANASPVVSMEPLPVQAASFAPASAPPTAPSIGSTAPQAAGNDPPWLAALPQKRLAPEGTPRPTSRRVGVLPESLVPRRPGGAAPGNVRGDPEIEAFAVRRQEGSPRADRAATDPLAQAMGATAPHGGWFADVMLAALGKYETGAKLAQPSRPPTISIQN